MSFQPTAMAGISNIPIGSVIAYQEFTATVTVNGVAGAQNTVVTAPTFVADGFSSYWVEFFCVCLATAANDFVIAELWESTTDIGRLATANSNGGTSGVSAPVSSRWRVTPAAGPRQYIIKAWRNAANGSISANTGGAQTDLPGYICVTKAG